MAERLVVRRGRLAYAALAVAALVVHLAAALGSSVRDPLAPVFADWLYCGLFALACGACALRAARRPDARGAWLLATGGVALWGGAEVVYRLLEPDPRAWFPVASQLMLGVGFPLAYGTLVLLARQRVRRVDRLLAFDGAIAGVTAAAVAAVWVLPAAGIPAPGSGAPPGALLVAALVGLAFCVTVVGLTGWRPGVAWSIVTAAIAINVLGDALLVDLAAGGEYRRGSAADTTFAASALMLGLAAQFGWRPAPMVLGGARRLPVPLGCGLVALAVLVAATGMSVGPAAIALSGLALALLLVRMTVAVELLERSRREAMTDPLTGLGNRRALLVQLRRRLAASPAPFVLALFDLDGFKGYNDRFGHLGGDALLRRMADRLERAVGVGAAFRMGGDEFCVLLDGGQADDDAADRLRAAQGALSEHGEAFTITSSCGTVELPAEAADATAALGLADARMYADKTNAGSSDRGRARDAVLHMVRERLPALHNHMAEVAELAADVARALGLDEVAVQRIAHAAELHDIGKIAVPDAILHKRARLDPDEWHLMRQHTLIGERILRTVPALDALAPLVRSSHERWDGGGYPDGLAGAEIPLGARIIAVCDAFHAMVEHRVHESPRPVGAALAELQRCRGTQFDPQVVDAFVAAVERRHPPRAA